MKVRNTFFKSYESDIRALIGAFYPGEEIIFTDDAHESVFLCVDCVAEGISGAGDRFTAKSLIKKSLYEELKIKTGRELPWGTLTGIRPLKIIEIYKAKGLDMGQIEEVLGNFFLISEEKRRLLMDIYRNEQRALKDIGYAGGVSIYINIPFCPTRCIYCGFTAYPFDEWREKAYEYIDAVTGELSAVDPGLLKRVKTVYIGGGTPSVLTEPMTDILLSAVAERIDTKSLIEYTFEAGRPETITRAKLKLLKDYGISRISINPQTMNDLTLKIIGRKHSVQDVKDAFLLAESMGFNNINMDVIAGLPGEGIGEFTRTLDEISLLDPASLTVHTLFVKRSSRLNTEGNAWGGIGRKGINPEDSGEIAGMVGNAAQYAQRKGLKPYYIYRQKNMAGNHENIGYARPGSEGIYNILMMGEKHSIIGIGAGATTKLVAADAGNGSVKIRRCRNVKNVAEYLARADELIREKREFLETASV